MFLVNALTLLLSLAIDGISAMQSERRQRLLLLLACTLMGACTVTETDGVTVPVTRPLATQTAQATDAPVAKFITTPLPTASIPLTAAPTDHPSPIPTGTPRPIPTATSTIIPEGIVYRLGMHIIQVQSDGIHTERFTLPAPPNDYGNLTLSPTGQYLLHNSSTPEDKHVYNLDTGETITLPQDDKTYIRHVYWWPARPDLLLLETIAEDIYDDSRYASSMFVLSDLDGTNWRPIHGRNIIHSLSLSPDGQTIIFLRDGQPYLYRVDQGEAPLNMSHYAAAELDDVTIERPRWSPNGDKVIWLMRGQKEGEPINGFAVFNFEQQSAQYLYPFANEGSEGWPLTPEWNVTGEQLAYINLDNCVITMFNNAGDTLFTDDISTCDINNDFWSPDGRWLTYFDMDNAAHMIVSAAGQAIQSLRPPSGGQSNTWLPDGRLLIHPSPAAPQRYWLYDVQTGTSGYFDLPENAEYLGWLPYAVAISSGAKDSCVILKLFARG